MKKGTYSLRFQVGVYFERVRWTLFKWTENEIEENQKKGGRERVLRGKKRNECNIKNRKEKNPRQILSYKTNILFDKLFKYFFSVHFNKIEFS